MIESSAKPLSSIASFLSRPVGSVGSVGSVASVRAVRATISHRMAARAAACLTLGATALALSSLSGCANSAKLTYLPNGNTGFAINCSGGDASSGWGDCYKQASDACGAYGYDIVSKDGEKGSASGGSIIGVFGANIRNRSMVIQCKK